MIEGIAHRGVIIQTQDNRRLDMRGLACDRRRRYTRDCSEELALPPL